MFQDLIKSRLGSPMNTVRRLLNRPEVSAPGGLRAQARDAKRHRIRMMRRDLYQLLEQHPASRQLMRHLDVVERALRREGLRGLDALPIGVIVRALEQLERLVWDWSPVGLAELRSRMAVMVKTRAPEAPGADADANADADAADIVPSAADVSEVDHSVFEEMERSWTGRVAVVAEPRAIAA